MAEVNEVCSMGLTFDLGWMQFTPVCSTLHSQSLWMPFGLLTFLSSHCFPRKRWKLQCVCVRARECVWTGARVRALKIQRCSSSWDFFADVFQRSAGLATRAVFRIGVTGQPSDSICYVLHPVSKQLSKSTSCKEAQMKSFWNLRPANWALHRCEPQLPQKGAARSQRRHQRAVCERETWM